MSQLNLTESQAIQLYKRLSSIDWAKVDPAKFNKLLAEAEIPVEVEGRNDVAQIAADYARAVKDMDQATFVAAVVNNDMPPIKLSRGSMEALKGGGTCYGCWAVLYMVLPDETVDNMILSGAYANY